MGVVVDSYRFASAGGGGFNPETDITWHSLFWAEGTAFAALGYADSASLTSWPNETAESDASTINGTAPTYDAAHASFNNQPVVNFGGAGSIKTAAYSVAPSSPRSIVLIMRTTSTTFGSFHDGITAGNRNVLYIGASSTWRIFAGTTEVSSGTTNTSPHMFRGTFTSDTGADPLRIDETLASNTNAGSHTLTGSTLGGDRAGGGFMTGQIALAGIYEGDISADPMFADFKSWVTSHYGITLA